MVVVLVMCVVVVCGCVVLVVCGCCVVLYVCLWLCLLCVVVQCV